MRRPSRASGEIVAVANRAAHRGDKTFGLRRRRRKPMTISAAGIRRCSRHGAVASIVAGWKLVRGGGDRMNQAVAPLFDINCCRRIKREAG